MRILYFSRSYTSHDYHFLYSLAMHSHEVHFLRLDGDAHSIFDEKLPSEVRPIQWRGAREPYASDEILALVPRLEEILRTIRPHVTHAGPVQTCGFMAALSGFHPLLTMSWGSDLLVDAGKSDLMTWITRYTLSHSDMLMTDCDEVSGAAMALSNHTAATIVQVPWGTDLQRFSPTRCVARSPIRDGWENSFVLLSTRPWEETYGIRTLLDGFRRAARRTSCLRLILLSDGSLRDFVCSYIRDHELSDVIDTPGQIRKEDLPDYFSSANAYVSCSLSDGTSVSLLEAMATGLPVIVTDRPSNREWVTPDRNGFLVPYGDSDALANALVRVANLDGQNRSIICRQNRAIAEERADWARNFSRLLDAYEKLNRGERCDR